MEASMENQLLVPRRRRTFRSDSFNLQAGSGLQEYSNIQAGSEFQKYSNLQAGSELQEYSSIQETSENMKKMVKEELQEYIQKNRASLKSESDIFGTLTFEVKACHVSAALKFLEEKGAVLKEKPAYDQPLRRNTKVRLTFYSKNLGIVNTSL